MLVSFFFIIVNVQVSADKFNYTCMGGESEIQGVDDGADMAETCRTFTLLGKRLYTSLSVSTKACFIDYFMDNQAYLFTYLGLKNDFQSDVFKMVAGILHLGNVVIRAVGSEQSAISVRKRYLMD